MDATLGEIAHALATTRSHHDQRLAIVAGDRGELYDALARAARGELPARSVRGNVLATTEFGLAMRLKYSLLGRDGKPLAAGETVGTTSFFVGTDVTTDERQALPLATEDLATRLVSGLSEGW